jgi:hypothetical protein
MRIRLIIGYIEVIGIEYTALVLQFLIVLTRQVSQCSL